MANIFKKKGCPQNCDDWRGIVVNSHAGKIFAFLLYDELKPFFSAYVGRTQFGGSTGMGTGPATHVVRTFMAIARIMNVCAFVLFVDLSKAFDSLVRETVLGWPEDLTPEQH